MGFTGLYLVLLGFNGLYSGFTEFSLVLLGMRYLTLFYQVLIGSSSFY